MKYKKGFTLIELLVVIAIIGILSAIILASVNNSRQNARDGQRISDLKQLENALELYSVANNYTYPADIYTGNPLANYISKMPVDPSTGANYKYIGLSGVGNTTGVPCSGYHLGVILEKNNSVLSGQKDSDFNSNGLALGERCNASGGLRFNGNDNFKCDNTTAGGYCYDIQK